MSHRDGHAIRLYSICSLTLSKMSLIRKLQILDIISRPYFMQTMLFLTYAAYAICKRVFWYWAFGLHLTELNGLSRKGNVNSSWMTPVRQDSDHFLLSVERRDRDEGEITCSIDQVRLGPAREFQEAYRSCACQNIIADSHEITSSRGGLQICNDAFSLDVPE